MSAVHIELVTDYTTEGFIATYKRFPEDGGYARRFIATAEQTSLVPMSLFDAN